MDDKTVMPLLDTTYFGKFNDGGYVKLGDKDALELFHFFMIIAICS